MSKKLTDKATLRCYQGNLHGGARGWTGRVQGRQVVRSVCPLRSGYEKHTPSLGWLEASILAEKQAPSFCGTDDSGVLQETKGGRWLDPMS